MSNYLADLEHDLRAAIRSGAHRPGQPASKRPRRLGTTIVLVFVSSVAVAVSALALVVRDENRRSSPSVVLRIQSQRPPPPSIAPMSGGHSLIDQAFAAFRRSRATSDVLSRSELLMLRTAIRRLDVRRSRLVYASPTLRLWLMPGSRPRARLCLLQTERLSTGGGGGSISCHANPRLPHAVASAAPQPDCRRCRPGIDHRRLG
jgi:hypothetical protein